MHLGADDSTFFLFILRSVICVNFKSIPDTTESSLVLLEFMAGDMLMLSFFVLLWLLLLWTLIPFLRYPSSGVSHGCGQWSSLYDTHRSTGCSFQTDHVMEVEQVLWKGHLAGAESGPATQESLHVSPLFPRGFFSHLIFQVFSVSFFAFRLHL